MRLTIERLRTMVLAAGGLLVVALAVFLVMGKYRNPLNRRDLPKKLGVDIQQEANGFTHAEFRAGHALFKITASKVEQLKNQRYRLHAVHIEMYSPDGKSTDSIEGNEFEYDQKSGIAKAAGMVEIAITRPVPAGTAGHGAGAGNAGSSANQIHVKTSGLIFDQKNEIASTTEHVEFVLAQGAGSATGATYASQQGNLVLDRDVSLHVERGGEPVSVTAAHAEVDRGDQVCRMTDAGARYRNGDLQARKATLDFRDDGTAEHLDASDGVVLTTATGGHLTAATGTVDFGKQNQPQRADLSGGVTIDSDENGRKVHGTSPTAALEFGAQGVLRKTHLERGVHLTVDQSSGTDASAMRTHRDWQSPVADLDFRDEGRGKVELAQMHGTGGVTVTGETRRGSGSSAPSRMTADEVTGIFGKNSALTEMDGVGHANLMETTANGTRQSTSGDRLTAHFVADNGANRVKSRKGSSDEASQIESATVVGHVQLDQQPAPTGKGSEAKPLHATAQQAVYEGTGEWLHLTGSPYIESAGLQLFADKVDVSQVSGDAFAHGNVKATWFGDTAGSGGGAKNGNSANGFALGSSGPAHVIATEAQMHQASGEATFAGNARLWQGANSVGAPVLILNRTKQSLVAQTRDAAQPVQSVLVGSESANSKKAGQSGKPSVIRVRSGDLSYSDAERTAVLHGGVLGRVTAENGDGVSRSDMVTLVLAPTGNKAGSGSKTSQVDRMTALGHVTVDLEGRYGTGEQLVYAGSTGEYVLTGTAAQPPRMKDPVRGDVTGGALIFNSRDDSVRVDGGTGKTLTETTVPKRP